MTKPWEKYQTTDNSDGPWSKYRAAEVSGDVPFAGIDIPEEKSFLSTLGEELVALPKAALLGLVGTRDKADWEHPLNYLSPWGTAHDVRPEDIYRAKGAQQAGDIAVSLAAWMTGEGLVKAGLSGVASSGALATAGKRLLTTAGGSIAAQAAEGKLPDSTTTAKDVAIAEGLALALGAPGRAMNAVKNFIGRPEAETLALARRIGVEPSLALASGGKGAQVIESSLTKSPGGAGVMEAHSNKLFQSVDGFIERMIQKAGGKADSATDLGANIRNALNRFTEKFSKEGEKKYDKFWALLPRNTRLDIKETKKTLDGMLDRYANDPGFLELMSNPKLLAISQAIKKSTDRKLDASTIRALRTDIGNAQNGQGVLAENSVMAELKNLYGAITRDMHSGALKTSPQAQAALKDADRFWFEGRRRIDDYLAPLSKKVDGDEAYHALFGEATAGGMKRLGPQRAKEILDALPPKERSEVISEIIDRMGRSPAGKQGAEGGEFSMSTYLTNWNKMNPKTKDVIFSNPSLRKDMDDLAKFAEKYKERTRLANTSNTAPAANFYTDLARLGGASAGWVTGGPVGAVAGALIAPVATAGASHVTAKMMTSPGFINWMAKVSRAEGPEEVGRLIGRLVALHANQPDLREDLENYVENPDEPRVTITKGYNK